MSTHRFRLDLELAGIATDAGQLDRPLPLRYGRIPEGLRLDYVPRVDHIVGEEVVGTNRGDAIVWDDELDGIEIDYQGCLGHFIRLADADPEALLAFARRWGILRICVHGIAGEHKVIRQVWFDHVYDESAASVGSILRDKPRLINSNCTYPTFYSPYLGDEERIDSDDHDELSYELLQDWRLYARGARALLSIAASLHRGREGNLDDWRSVYERSLRDDPAWTRGHIERLAGGDFDIQRTSLNRAVQEWLSLGDVRPIFRWMDRGPEIVLWTGGLFGALAIQLAFAMARVDGLAVCAACGAPFVPWRRPAPGRRSFCWTCGKKAADRFAARDSRSRRRRRH